MSSHLYSSAYSPAAPVLVIGVRRAGDEAPEVLVEAMIDSGADGTLLPVEALDELGAEFVATRLMRPVSGRAYPVDLYLVTLRVGEHLIHGVRAVAAAEGSEPLLGRDVLNQLVITLDGPAEVTEVAR